MVRFSVIISLNNFIQDVIEISSLLYFKNKKKKQSLQSIIHDAFEIY